MNTGLTMTISQQRRRAEVTITSYYARRLNIPEGVVPCHVLGIFQSADEDGACPVAVCELNDGRMLEPTISYVRFTDTVNGEIQC